MPHNVIEIPLDSEPVKYQVDKATGAILVDRMLKTAMRYPRNSAPRNPILRPISDR